VSGSAANRAGWRAVRTRIYRRGPAPSSGTFSGTTGRPCGTGGGQTHVEVLAEDQPKLVSTEMRADSESSHITENRSEFEDDDGDTCHLTVAFDLVSVFLWSISRRDLRAQLLLSSAVCSAARSTFARGLVISTL